MTLNSTAAVDDVDDDKDDADATSTGNDASGRGSNSQRLQKFVNNQSKCWSKATRIPIFKSLFVLY